MTTMHMRLQGRDIPYRQSTIPIESLRLDPKNPRLQYLVQQLGPNVNDVTLHDAIWAKDKTKELANSIYQNGGVREAIYVVERVTENSNIEYLVREGNNRTVAARELLKKYAGDLRFSHIPAFIFSQNMSDEDWAVLLADFHVAGKIAWDVYEQARHVWELHKRHMKTYDFLCSHLRMTRTRLSQLLQAYDLTKEYLNDHEDPANVKKFSFFHEVIKRKFLRELLESNKHFKTDLILWLDTERLYDSKQVRNLPMILANQEAKKALDTKGYDEAIKTLYKQDPALESGLFAAIKHATDIIKTAPANEIQALKNGNAQKIIMLRNLSTAIKDIATLSNLNL